MCPWTGFGLGSDEVRLLRERTASPRKIDGRIARQMLRYGSSLYARNDEAGKASSRIEIGNPGSGVLFQRHHVFLFLQEEVASSL